MRNMRIPLIIAWTVAVLGIVLGSFFDLQISQAIASPDNGFALTVSAIGPTIGFAGVAAMGGGLVALAIKGKYHIALKILFYVLAAACLGVSIYYPGGEYFGINGFYGSAPGWVGYLIVIIPEGAAMYGGYLLFRNCKNHNMWIVFVSIIALLCLALLAIIPTIKDNMHRPRFRILKPTIIDFHNWWKPCRNYKDLMAMGGIESSDHFKSFPSGHTAEASIILYSIVLFPLGNPNLKKYQLPAFIGGGCLVLLVAFARILAAAHFLSDVSMGAFIMITLLLIDNEVITHIKALHQEEQPIEE